MTTTDPTHTPTDPTNPTGAEDQPTTPVPDATRATGELLPFPLDALVPHPDNPRTSLGDLEELARSIKAHGVLQPLVVLPAGDDGRHLIVTGHRRHAAAAKAKATHVPAVIRDLTPAEVVEAMLIENVNRSALTTSEEVKAIERLMDLNQGKLTPAKLCKRIGRSQGWVRTRMAICALPAQWREAIDKGELSLAAGEAAASVADLGPDHVEELCRDFSRHTWGDHARLASEHRQRVEREAAYEAAVAKAKRRKGAVVFTSDDDPYDCMPVSDFLDGDAAKVHRREPCHAVLIERTTYGQGFERIDICTDPESHLPADDGSSVDGDGDAPPVDGDSAGTGGGRESGGARPGPPVAPSAPKGPDLDSPHLKRKGRLARIAHAAEVFAKPRGGISQTQATRLALRALIHEAGIEALGFAAQALGVEDRSYGLTDRLIASADTPAALARVAAAVAIGIAETRMYHGSSSTPCRDYMDMLTGAGWQPDTWTAAVIDRLHRREQGDGEHTDSQGQDHDEHRKSDSGGDNGTDTERADSDPAGEDRTHLVPAEQAESDPADEGDTDAVPADDDASGEDGSDAVPSERGPDGEGQADTKHGDGATSDRSAHSAGGDAEHGGGDPAAGGEPPSHDRRDPPRAGDVGSGERDGENTGGDQAR